MLPNKGAYPEGANGHKILLQWILNYTLLSYKYLCVLHKASNKIKLKNELKEQQKKNKVKCSQKLYKISENNRIIMTFSKKQ